MLMQKWRALLLSTLMGSVLGIVLLVSSPAYAQCPAGITSLWDLDELNGPDYFDSVGDNDGLGDALNPTTPVAGVVDGAQQFDGADTAVTVTSVDSFNWASNASFSIEYWIRRTDDAFTDPAEVVVGRDDGATSQMQWWAGLWDDGTVAFVLLATDGTGLGSRATGEFLEGNDDLTDGAWHHVAVVRDADEGATGETRLYVDGVLNDSVDTIDYVTGGGSFGSATAVLPASTADLNIGWLNQGPEYNFNGTLDEVAIYGRVLEANEILQHFNDELSYCFVPDDDDDDDDNGGGGGGGGGCFIESLR